MTNELQASASIKLSVCIATFNRAGFIGETLDAIVPQLNSEVELVVVDGASTDHTADLMMGYAARHREITYRREPQNCGVDEDFDKAVQFARGEYCWLLSDDDIIAADAISTVLNYLSDSPQLVVVNAEIRTRELTGILKPNQLEIAEDRQFRGDQEQEFFATTAAYLTFIGAVVIRREIWLSRDRASYFGSQFIHVGVIFQPPPLAHSKIIAKPLIRIRYGNALWTARAFDIWMEKWPLIVWSIARFDESAKKAVVARHPAQSIRFLLWYRALGAYGKREYQSLVSRKRPHHPLAGAIAVLPARASNAAVALYLLVRHHSNMRVMLYDLFRSQCSSAITRWSARRFQFPGTER
jgi:abequosyltransferase